MFSTGRKSKKILSLLPISLVAVMALSIAPTALAYGGGQANWQLTVAETAVNPGQNGFGVWGWCELSGSPTPSSPTSGSSGDCQATIYIHAPGPHNSATCHFSFDISSWAALPLGSSGQGQFFGITNDLVIVGGTTSYTPSPGCTLLQATGGVSATGTDLGPAQTGHYNLNFLLFGSKGTYQEQITQTSH